MKREEKLLKKAFEKTPTLMQALSTLRSRRVGKGYSLESGEEEVHPATKRALRMEKGPLAFISKEEPEPLSSLETALLCWAACGPNGIISGDIPINSDFSNLMGYSGRTIASACNDSSVDLIFINDHGTFLYKPKEERSKPVEIEGEEDYQKVLDWFEEGTFPLSENRLDIDWCTGQGRPMGVWQYNLNRTGTTWFIPVADIAKAMINMYFSAFEHMHWLVIDEQTGQPAGLEEWAKPGLLELPITERQFEENLLRMADYQMGMLIQNLRLTSEALGLGCWVFGGFCQELLMGGFRPVAKGLGFRYKTYGGRKHFTGIPRLLEGFGLPAPWHSSLEELVDKVLSLRQSKIHVHGPHKPEVSKTIIDHPRLKVPSWCVDAAKALVKYFFERYGRYPVHFSPYQMGLNAQVHHIDEEFYQRYCLPGYISPWHKGHFNQWHSEEA